MLLWHGAARRGAAEQYPLLAGLSRSHSRSFRPLSAPKPQTTQHLYASADASRKQVVDDLRPLLDRDLVSLDLQELSPGWMIITVSASDMAAVERNAGAARAVLESRGATAVISGTHVDGKKMVCCVFGACFLLRAARARARGLCVASALPHAQQAHIHA